MTSGRLRAIVPPLLLFAACEGSPGPVTAAADAEGLLFGGQSCRKDTECATGVCSLGMCAGYLMASHELARETMAPAFKAAGADPVTSRALLEAAASVLSDPENDRFLRSRAADAIGLLGPAVAVPALAPFLEDQDEPVRFFAARALHRNGDPRGTAVLRAFLHHPAKAVRALAADALGS